MYIYGELVIGLNFIMNSLILILTAYVAGKRLRRGGAVAAALLGSVYALGEALPNWSHFYIMPAKLLVAAAMVYLAFGYKTTRSFALTAAIFFIVSFILGGAVIGWLHFWENQIWGTGGLTLDFTKLAAGVLMAVVLVFLAGRWLSAQVFRRQNSYLFTVRYAGREFTGKGFLDTGNFLYSPVGRRPVVLLTKEACQQLLPRDAADYLQKTAQENRLGNLTACRDEKWLSRLEIIPYAALGSNDVLLGFRPDEIIVFDQDGSLASSHVVVAVTDEIFDDGACSALLHPALLTQSNLKKEAAVCALSGR